MHNFKLLFTTLFVTAAFLVSAQKLTIDGYVFEEHNRGFLNEVNVTVLDQNGILSGKTMSDTSGHFSIDVDAGKNYTLQFEKKVFKPVTAEVTTIGKKAGDKIFLEKAIPRLPGYLLEASLTEKRNSEDIPVDAINGARVEIYNNTKHKEELVLDSIKSPNFSFTLQQGNNYSILIRKKGFFTRRLEARVNIDGCYLCMEGFGTVTPGVLDNLTSSEDNKIGSLIANLELDRINTTRNIVVDNIYYEYNSANITAASRKELDKIINVLKLNPSIIMELGSHTDSRGSDEFNQRLSQSRAQAAVDYLVNKSAGNIDNERIKAKGYGERHLINRCSDGVQCSEEEHAKNRRTELRVIGFRKDANENKSLLEIIHQEEMQKFLASDESDKEYKVPFTNTPKPEKRIMTARENALPENKTPTAPINTPIPKKELPNIQIESKSVQNSTAVSNPNVAINVTPIGNYTGYKIELIRAATPLGSNELKNIAENFSSEISTDKLTNGQISYLIGNITGWSEAERFLGKVTEKYPNAKIIDYYNGKRLEH